MEPEQEVLVALRRIIRAVDLQSKKLMQTSGLTGPQLTLLDVLGRDGAMTVGELARAVSLSQGTITSIVDRLERRGYLLRRRSDNDKRKVLVSLSERGQAALQQAPTLLQESFVNDYRALQTWEQHLILSSLQRVAQMMQAHQIDAAPYLDNTVPIDGDGDRHNIN